MAKHRINPNEMLELGELHAEISDLKNHIRTLIDAIDDVRTELQYLATNRTAAPGAHVPSPVLKQMAVDPTTTDWSDRLVVARRGGKFPATGPTEQSAEPTSAHEEEKAFEVTDAVEFFRDGKEAFGEIVSMDEVRQEATLMLIPSEERVVVPLNALTWVDPRDDEEPPLTSESATPPKTTDAPKSAISRPENLFKPSGDQRRLF